MKEIIFNFLVLFALVYSTVAFFFLVFEYVYSYYRKKNPDKEFFFLLFPMLIIGWIMVLASNIPKEICIILNQNHG